jgi:PAS domain S-box-containing protein
LVEARETAIAARLTAEAHEKTMRNVLETSPDSISIHELRDHARFLFANQAFTTLHGYTLQEVTGKAGDELPLFAQPDQMDLIERTIKTAGQVRDLEIQFLKKNKEVVDALISATVVKYDGKPCAIAMERDITGRKRAERDLIAAREAAPAASKSQVGVSLEHVARDSHADERGAGHGRSAQRDRTHSRAAALSGSHALVG